MLVFALFKDKYLWTTFKKYIKFIKYILKDYDYKMVTVMSKIIDAESFLIHVKFGFKRHFKLSKSNYTTTQISLVSVY